MKGGLFEIKAKPEWWKYNIEEMVNYFKPLFDIGWDKHYIKNMYSPSKSNYARGKHSFPTHGTSTYYNNKEEYEKLLNSDFNLSNNYIGYRIELYAPDNKIKSEESPTYHRTERHLMVSSLELKSTEISDYIKLEGVKAKEREISLNVFGEIIEDVKKKFCELDIWVEIGLNFIIIEFFEKSPITDKTYLIKKEKKEKAKKKKVIKVDPSLLNKIEKDSKGRKRVFIIATDTAIIDDELGYFKHAFNVLTKTKEGKHLKDEKNLAAYIFVDVDFSTGSGLFLRDKGGEFRESNEEEWNEIGELFRQLKLNSLKDIKACKELGVFKIDTYNG